MGAATDYRKLASTMPEHFRDEAWGAGQLRGVPLFASFTEDELKALYRIGELISLSPKAHAVIEGEPTYGMYMLLEGTVSVYKNNTTTGGLSRIAVLEAGAHFGELSLFDQAIRSATVSAETACHLFYLGVMEFENYLVSQGNGLELRFFKTVAVQLAARIRSLNTDYIASQQMLWRYALRKGESK